MRVTRSLLLVAFTGGLACFNESGVPVEPESAGANPIISDGSTSGREGFLFLPPMVPTPTATGTFDATLHPRARICELDVARSSCAVVLVTLTGSGSGANKLKSDVVTASYAANWHSPASLALSTPGGAEARYRVEVELDVGILTTVLGYADLWVVDKLADPRSIPSGYVALARGGPFQVRFRILTSAIGYVTVTPGAVNLQVGGTQQFAAAAFDLHNSPVAGATFEWSSDDAGVAAVSASGLGTGVSPGTTTINATTGGVEGSAAFEVLGGGETLVTPSGGTAWSGDRRVRLDFPPGALPVPTTITITPATGLPDDERLVDGTTYTFGPADIQFQQPVTLTIDYGTLPPGQAGAEQFLWLHKLVGGQWVEQPGTPADLNAQTVSGPISGFSSYGAMLSQLSNVVQVANAALQAMLTSATTQSALALRNAIDAIQQMFSFPAYQTVAQPVVTSIGSQACAELAKAAQNAQSTTVDTYQELTTLLDDLYNWEAIVTKAVTTCAPSVDVRQLGSQKFGEFVAFTIARLAQANLSSDFPKLEQELNLLITLQANTMQLEFPQYHQQIIDEAQHPLLDAMRVAAYKECRTNGTHEYLGKLVSYAFQQLGTYSDDDVFQDLQYCGTDATWTARTPDQTVMGTGTLGGGPTPGVINDKGTATVASDGTVTWTNLFRAFKCPSGAYEADELVVTLGGKEVHRLTTAPSGNFFNAALVLHMASALTTAGIDPVQSPGPHAMELARQSAGCGQYLRTPNVPITLVTLDLTLQAPAGPSCPASESWMFGIDDRSNGVATVSLSHLLMTVNGSVSGTTTAGLENWSPEIHLNGTAWDYVKVIPLTPITPAIQLYAKVSATGQAQASISGRLQDGSAELTLYSGWLDNSLIARAGERSPTSAMQETQQIGGIQTVGIGWSDRDWWEARMRIAGFARHRGSGNSATVSGNLSISVTEVVDDQGRQVPVLICSAGGINYGTGAPGSPRVRGRASFPTQQRTRIVPP